MKKKVMKKLLFAFAFMVFAVVTPSVKVSASSYNYDFFKNPVPSSEGLSYKATYNDTAILAADGSDEKLTFDVLSDMEIVGEKIFVIDSRANATDKVHLQSSSSKVDIVRRSGIYILNSDMKWESEFYQFEINDTVKQKLDEFYKRVDYTTAPEAVTATQLNATSVAARAPYTTIWVPNENGQEELLVETLEDKTEIYEKGDWKLGLFLYGATGISVTNYGGETFIYVADTGNARVLKLAYDEANNSLIAVDVYLTPDDETVFFQFDEDIKLTTKKVFQPTKVTVDRYNRVYVISDSVYEGILEYNTDSSFNRFLGKNLVTANPLKAFWGKIFSETQLNLIEDDLPPSFTNIQMAPNGFIYATALSASSTGAQSQKIKAINTSGADILRRNGYVTPDGDVKYLNENSKNRDMITGASTFVAIAVNEDGIYSAVDTVRGRIFTYDSEGNLLYISGEKGSLSNSINTPSAIAYLSKPGQPEYVVVLDKGSKTLMLYETTEFGRLVNSATQMYADNYIIESEDIWREVVKMNSNYELGYVGIGKSILRLAMNAELRWNTLDVTKFMADNNISELTKDNVKLLVNEETNESTIEINGVKFEIDELKENKDRAVEISFDNEEKTISWRYAVATEEEKMDFYKEAMSYFKLGRNATYYSKAYQFYRDGILKENFALIMGGGVVIVIAYIAYMVTKKVYTKKLNKLNNKEEESDV